MAHTNTVMVHIIYPKRSLNHPLEQDPQPSFVGLAALTPIPPFLQKAKCLRLPKRHDPLLASTPCSCPWVQRGPEMVHCSICLLLLFIFCCCCSGRLGYRSISSVLCYLLAQTQILGCSLLSSNLLLPRQCVQNLALQKTSRCIRRTSWLREGCASGL